jgi:17beta-estradiol 17-dehydrogenase / very-long-chain 3-oxoacyl-CoA reductase
MMALVSRAATALGYGLLAYTSVQFLQFLYFNLRPSSLPRYGKKHRLYKPTSKTWALITGATDGLGVAWAHELAARGFNIILHGRNPSKLATIKADLETTHKVQVRTLVLDAEHQPIAFDPASYTAFDKAILDVTADIPLTLLVNNIGVIGDWYPVADFNPAYIDESININVRFATQLTRVLLPTLARNAPGLVLNVSSESDSAPVAYATMYTGAKSWGQAFHRSLRYEMRYEGHDIEVLSLVYGFIATGSTGRNDADVGFGVLSPRGAARAALGKVGCGYSTVTPDFSQQVQGWVVRLLPIGVKEALVAKVMREQKDRMEGIAKKK